MLINIITQSILFFTTEFFIISIMSIGFLTYNKEIFGKTLFIILFTMVFNTYLKSLWQIPLPIEINKNSWAFPSGHMQIAIVLWGWLTWSFKTRLFSIFSCLLLIGIAVSLVSCGFHNILDISGAVFFGVISLILYNFLLKIPLLSKQNKPLIGIFLSVLTIPLIFLIPKSYTHLWVAQGGLLGFSLGWYLNENFLTAKTKRKFMLLFITILGIILIYLLSDLVKYLLPTNVLRFLQFFTISL